MRNIIQYPITTNEIVETLQRLHSETLDRYARDGVCGDMTAAVLVEAIKRIESQNALTDQDAS